jgi:type I restriction enzyme S subunit
MRINLRELRIGDLGKVVTGKTPSSSKPEMFGHTYPFITPSDMNGRDRHIQTERFLSAVGAQAQSRLILPPRSVCVVCIGATIGKLCMVDRPSFSNQQINAVIVDEDEFDPFFVYHLLTPLGDELKATAGGAATPIINKTAFSEIKVKVPPLAIQRRIAGILSAYDDLIENGQRRIGVLERMSRGLYREWFMKFRFPGHESVPLVASPLGDIPQGWEVKKLGEVADAVNRGISPTYDENGDSLVINQKCIRDQRINLEPARRQTKPLPPDKVVRFGDVLINSTGVGTLGRVAQVYQDFGKCSVDTHVTIVRAKADIDVDFFGCCLHSEQETFERLGVGATGQTELSRTAIATIEICIPPDELQKLFGRIVRATRTSVINLTNQIQNLRRTRDLLLPRLLSCELAIL